MVKKTGLLILVIIFILSIPVFAAEQTSPPQVSIETISLDKCLDLAFKNSQTLKAAAKNVEIAKAGVNEASGGFWPSLSYQYSYLDDIEKPDVPGMPPSVMNMFLGTGYSGSVSLNQSLYTGGRLTSTLKLAKLKLASAQEDERKAKQQLTYNVKESYYRFWLAEKILEVSQNTYDNMERHYKQVNNSYQAGTASKFDLLRAQVQCENQKPQLIKARNGLTLARLNLATQIGLEHTQVFKVEYNPTDLKLPEIIDLTPQSLLDEAFQKRPELHQIQQLSEVAKTNEQLAKSGYLPSLSLSYGYSWQGASNIDLSNGSKVVSLRLGLSGVLFNGFATDSRVTAAKENYDLAQIRENTFKDQIRLEAEQALQSLEESLETTKANQANSKLAEESLKMTQVRFTAGMATTSDIADAQLALEQALNGYYQGISSYLTGLAKLDLIAGKDN